MHFFFYVWKPQVTKFVVRLARNRANHLREAVHRL